MSNITDTTPKLRGRPPRSEEQTDKMRRRIIEAARHLFHQEGYDSISIRRLAKEVGYTPMSIYTYFDSKIDILHALWADVFANLFAEVNAAQPNNAGASGLLHAMCKAYVQFWLAHRDSYRMVFMSAGIDQSDVSTFVNAATAVSNYQIFFTALADATNRPIADIAGPAQTLICGMNGIAHSLITISGYPWDTADTLVALLVDGVILNATAL